jgi:hypothetical protein
MDKNTQNTLVDEITNIEAFTYGLDHLNDSEAYVFNFKPKKEGVYYDVIFKWPEEGAIVRFNRKFMDKERVQKILEHHQNSIKNRTS